MRQISIQDLKATLSAVVSEAEAGDTIVITRHNEPVAKLIPAHADHLYQGKGAGKGGIRPALKRGTKIPYLDFLREDRGNR
jgi:prevent-host-death family protein